MLLPPPPHCRQTAAAAWRHQAAATPTAATAIPLLHWHHIPAAPTAAGAILETTGRDFTSIFALTAVVEVLGACAFLAWWDSERVFD